MVRTTNIRLFSDSLISVILLSVVLLSVGCSRNSNDDMAALRANPNVEEAGPYIVFGAMAAAADYLETDFDAVARIMQTQSVIVDSSTASQGLSDGQYLLYPEGTEPALIDEVIFENTSNDKVVLFVESFSQTRESQGFSYVKLDPGSKFVYQHNVPPAVVKVAVAGGKVIIVVGGVIVLEELKSVFNDQFRCNLSTKAIQPDECVGWCTGSTCRGVPGSTVPYGPSFLGMAQPTACGC